ncbi:hypothetical protein B9Z55_026843 [Caenorhabditis nigoni]|uniref:F-box domain-containing protein n=1 Tax=Caenorhabditis nigoni TaxID=1611254 RepID=A0A2G5SI54_9PELO|nr:hypothetical protein B9Z55_026843 [Caenorhabditis nigoni]
MEQSTSIKTEEPCLKTHILFEALEKKPIFASYQSFCKKVGQDTMSYPDFEFWWYRFYHGQPVFDHDRSMDPVPKTLMDLPVLLMRKVTENFDPMERSVLRRVNRAMKDVVDSHPAVFEKIEIKSRLGGLSYRLNNKRTVYSRNGKLEKLFKIPGFNVNHLRLYNDPYRSEDDLIDLLPGSLTPKSIDISACTAYKIIKLLLIAKPKHLESIHIDLLESPQVVGPFSRIFEAQQMKQAKFVEVESFERLDVEFLKNFQQVRNFKMELPRYTSERDLRRARDIISTFKGFEKCELQIFDNKIREFCEAFGEVIPDGPSTTVYHRYQIPESNEYLEFSIECDSYSIITVIKSR